MPMSHRAFAFRYTAFAAELKPLVEAGDAGALTRFIDAHRTELREPDHGEPVFSEWARQVEPGDVQTRAKLALTRYYDPRADLGLGLIWQRFQDTRAVLGRALPPFDPGGLGSYFQSEAEVTASIARVLPTVEIEGELLVSMLRAAEARGLGLYVTF
ncbi:MAG: hypothetical protein IPJ65_29500 [Archangiaceae bacterium]|nr:hypothetical protein [Archangiaceae bacterium]